MEFLPTASKGCEETHDGQRSKEQYGFVMKKWMHDGNQDCEVLRLMELMEYRRMKMKQKRRNAEEELIQIIWHHCSAVGRCDVR